LSDGLFVMFQVYIPSRVAILLAKVAWWCLSYY